MGSNDPQTLSPSGSYSQLQPALMANSGEFQLEEFDIPGLVEFFEHYHSLPEDARNTLTAICGPDFPASLLQIGPHTYRLQDPDVFFFICFTLAKQSSLDALEAWVQIPRGTDTARLHCSDDKSTIDVSICRQIGYTTSVIMSRLKDAGHYFEPMQQLWVIEPPTQEPSHQLEASGELSYGQSLSPISQESSVTNLETSKSFDRAPTPPFPYLSDTSDSDQHLSQASGNSTAAEGSLQRTSSTTTVRNFGDQRVESVSDGHCSLSTAPSLGCQHSPSQISAAQCLLELCEQAGSSVCVPPRSLSPAATHLSLGSQDLESVSEGHRSQQPLSAAPTLTSFGEQQAGSASDDDHSLSATPTFSSFSSQLTGSVSDGHRYPFSATPSLVSTGSGFRRHGSFA